jgi:tRNA-specific 2-thiouridylase
MNFLDRAQILQDYGIIFTPEIWEKNQSQTVVVGMSGGVDSSVCALLLKLQGYKVIGLFMKNWDETNPDGTCSADLDYQDVIKVCEKIEIPYYSVNLVKEYWEGVFSEFLQDYKKGLTPNPDILCNREIKFKVFLEKAILLGADYLATGHYCQLFNGQLIKGKDENKDQTYFLYAVEKKAFNKVLFPIGHLQKQQVRELAEKFKLATSKKKDSTGICFIGERNFKNFLSQYIDSTKGDFVDLEGRRLGQHDGTCFYTLGQRKGMGVGGPGGPWFVVGKNLENNQVILAQGDDHPSLYSDGLIAHELNWMAELPKTDTMRANAKVRYRQKDEPCTIRFINGEVEVIFDRPQRAITPRQSVVFYMGEVCLGGGMIKSVMTDYYTLNKQLPEVISIQV